MNSFNNEIAICKGLAIILVVMGHADFPPTMRSMIYLFHMPLFFFVSGYCFKSKYLDNPVLFIRRRFLNLWLPFAFWGMLFIIFHNWLLSIHFYSPEIIGSTGGEGHIFSTKEILQRSVDVVLGMRNQDELLHGYWFLKSLLFASIVSLFFIKFIKSDLLRIGLALGIAIIVYTFPVLHIPFYRIYGWDWMGCAFFLTGYYFQQKGIMNINFSNIKSALIILFGLFYLYELAVIHRMNITYLSLNNVLLYFVGALIGIVCIYELSKHIIKNNFLRKVLSYVGSHTLIILTLHVVAFKLVSFIAIIILDKPIDHLAYAATIKYLPTWWSILYSIVGVVIPIFIFYTFDNLKNIVKNIK